jgi:predicted transposase/invertase (TIGR01784 family)
MTSYYNREDQTYKYIAKSLGVRFHRYLGYEGDQIQFNNVELVPLASDNKFMDICYDVDDEYSVNVEHQSSHPTNRKMKDIYKYHIYQEIEGEKPVKSCILATYDPPKNKNKEIDVKYNIRFHPDFHYIKDRNASEVLSNIKSKVINNIPLTDNEAIDLIVLPDMKHNYDNRELLKTSSRLLVDAVIHDPQFHVDLIDCQNKMLKRFLSKKEYEEMKHMLNLKAEDYGLKPHTTGFEESIALAYLDGIDDGTEKGIEKGIEKGMEEGIEKEKEKTAKKLLELGIDEETIQKATELNHDQIQKLKKE